MQRLSAEFSKTYFHLRNLVKHIEKLSAHNLSCFPCSLRARVSRQQHLLLRGGEVSVSGGGVDGYPLSGVRDLGLGLGLGIRDED